MTASPLFASPPPSPPSARAPRTSRAVLYLTFALLAGCITDGEKRAEPSKAQAALRSPDGFVLPSDGLVEQIEARAQAVRVSRDLNTFAREAEWFVGVGEPAFPTLLELAGDSDVRVASFGLATISAQRDPRLLTPLKREVARPADPMLRFEYARALLALGDWSELPVLVEGLEHEDVRIRGNALKALFDATGERNGFHPQGAPEDRAAAVARWRAWWTARAADKRLTPVDG